MDAFTPEAKTLYPEDVRSEAEDTHRRDVNKGPKETQIIYLCSN